MNEFQLFGVSVALSVAAWGYVCLCYVWPRIRERSLASAARPMVVLHLFRFVGASFLVVGVVSPTLPRSFAEPAAYGDLLSVVLAWVALLTLRGPAGVAALWVFNVWGTIDLMFAFYKGAFGGAFGPDFHAGALGATFFIPTLCVPLLMWTHGMLFALLLRPRAAGGAGVQHVA